MSAIGAMTPSICRDCLAEEAANGRCARCGSPRIVVHRELLDLSLVHVDCDAFYATIEKRDDPTLGDRPVIVGGGRRGVVMTACYVARTYGVHSAMPMFKALKACPHAVIVPPRMATYAAEGRKVRQMMLELTPAVEPLSIDEAFLDLTGTQRLHAATPAATMIRFQRRVEAELGITVSVGFSHNKFLAKIASELDKPRGFAVIGMAETEEFLAERPISVIWGVGKVMQARLARDGLTTIGQLQRLDPADLAARYGALGLRLSQLSRGLDARTVTSGRAAKTVSAETTFDADLHDAAALLPILRRLSEKVSGRLKADSQSGRTVTLKLKARDFRVRSRSLQLDDRTNLADRIYTAGRALLLKEMDGTRFRLLGIGVSDIGAAAAGMARDMLDPASDRRAMAEAAMDAIRLRFGADEVGLGLTFTPKEKPRR